MSTEDNSLNSQSTNLVLIAHILNHFSLQICFLFDELEDAWRLRTKRIWRSRFCEAISTLCTLAVDMGTHSWCLDELENRCNGTCSMQGHENNPPNWTTWWESSYGTLFMYGLLFLYIQGAGDFSCDDIARIKEKRTRVGLKLQYERLPWFCYACGYIGHQVMSCARKFRWWTCMLTTAMLTTEEVRAASRK